MHPAKLTDSYSFTNDPHLRAPGSLQHIVFRTRERPFYCHDPNTDFTEVPKGLKQTVWEQGFLTEDTRMKGKLDRDGKIIPRSHAPKLINEQMDFKWEPCVLAEYIKKQGHICIFSPKFHPELNFRERAWGRAKFFLRLYCNYTFPGLKAKLPIALGLRPMTNEQRGMYPRLKDIEYNLYLRLVIKHSKKKPEII